MKLVDFLRKYVKPDSIIKIWGRDKNHKVYAMSDPISYKSVMSETYFNRFDIVCVMSVKCDEVDDDDNGAINIEVSPYKDYIKMKKEIEDSIMRKIENLHVV